MDTFITMEDPYATISDINVPPSGDVSGSTDFLKNSPSRDLLRKNDRDRTNQTDRICSDECNIIVEEDPYSTVDENLHQDLNHSRNNHFVSTKPGESRKSPNLLSGTNGDDISALYSKVNKKSPVRVQQFSDSKEVASKSKSVDEMYARVNKRNKRHGMVRTDFQPPDLEIIENVNMMVTSIDSNISSISGGNRSPHLPLSPARSLDSPLPLGLKSRMNNNVALKNYPGVMNSSELWGSNNSLNKLDDRPPMPLPLKEGNKLPIPNPASTTQASWGYEGKKLSEFCNSEHYPQPQQRIEERHGRGINLPLKSK